MSDPTLEQKITAALRDGIIAQTQIDDYDAPYVSTEHYPEPDLLVDGKISVAHLAAVLAAVVRDEIAEAWEQGIEVGGNCGCPHDTACRMESTDNPHAHTTEGETP